MLHQVHAYILPVMWCSTREVCGFILYPFVPVPFEVAADFLVLCVRVCRSSEALYAGLSCSHANSVIAKIAWQWQACYVAELSGLVECWWLYTHEREMISLIHLSPERRTLTSSHYARYFSQRICEWVRERERERECVCVCVCVCVCARAYVRVHLGSVCECECVCMHVSPCVWSNQLTRRRKPNP